MAGGLSIETAEYRREFTDAIGPRVRRRIGYDHERGNVTRFVLQLEYELSDEWAVIVRFDHNPGFSMGHDVSEEGVHMDVYREGEKIRSEEVVPPMNPAVALTFAEEHLRTHARQLLRGLNDGTDSRSHEGRRP